MREVAFDESGHTGENLLDSNQPVYALASVGLSLDDATALLPPQRNSEFHFKDAVRSGPGRRQILEVLASPLLTQESVRVAWVDKSFMTTAKIVSLVLEPYYADRGIFIENDATANGIASALHSGLHRLDPNAFVTLQASFVAFVRGAETGTKFQASVDELADVGEDPDLNETIHALQAASTEFIGSYRDREHPEPLREGLARDNVPLTPTLHPGFPCLTALFHAWGALAGDFAVIHDEHLEARVWGPWLAQLHAEADRGVVESSFGPLRYPVPVADFRFARSQDDARIQLADLVAGVTAMLATTATGRHVRDGKFVETLRRRVPQLTDWIELGVAPS